VLVDEAGADEDFNLTATDGTESQRRWRYPSRAECLVCHNATAGGSLSFNTAQLHRTPDSPAGATHQILALQAAGYFGPAAVLPHTQPVLAPPADESTSLTWRARSWLAVNCAYCHQPGGLGGAQFDARLETPLDLARLIPGTLNNSTDTNRSLVLPGQPARSELHARLRRRGPGQMPPLATEIPDPQGTLLMERWILEAAGRDVFDLWRSEYFEDLTAPTASPGENPGGDTLSNLDEFRLNSSPLTADLPWQLQVSVLPDGRLKMAIRHSAGRAVQFQSRTAVGGAEPWEPVDGVAALPRFASAAGEASIIVAPAEPARFYRAQVLVP